MTHHKPSRLPNRGFALLITLFVVGAVVSIAATIVELGTKQLNLSVTARDSEIAFHAANAGLECARYARRTASSSFEANINQILYYCFDEDQYMEREFHSLDVSGPGDVYRYRGEVTWPTADRCSVVDMIVMVPDADAGNDLRIADLSSLFPGFESGLRKDCRPDEMCTIAQVTGYNTECTDISDTGVVRREILLEF